jgi:hypothetical protein
MPGVAQARDQAPRGDPENPSAIYWLPSVTSVNVTVRWPGSRRRKKPAETTERLAAPARTVRTNRPNNDTSEDQLREKEVAMTRFKILLIACMAILGVTAVSAAAAQAAPHWNVAGAALPANTPKNVETVTSSAFVLKTEILGHPNEEINCASLTTTGAFIKGTKADGATKLEFKTCSLPTAPACTVANIVTNEVASELIEVPATGSGTIYDRYTAPSGTFAKVKIGGGCALEGTYKVTGSVAGEDPKDTTETEKHQLFFSEAISSAASTALEFEMKPAVFTGNITLRLTGHENWSSQH